MLLPCATTNTCFVFANSNIFVNVEFTLSTTFSNDSPKGNSSLIFSYILSVLGSNLEPFLASGGSTS